MADIVDVKKTSITMVKKRNGDVVLFDPEKIAKVIFKAAVAVGGSDKELARSLAWKVVEQLEKKGYTDKNLPNVEEIQDTVETVLIEGGHAKTAKAFILRREKRAEIRRAKAALGVEDDLKFPLNTLMVFSARYLRKDENRKIIETPKQLFRRVAKAISEAEKNYGATAEELVTLEEKFYDMMITFEFLPNSPTLMNAGTELGQLSACFVLPVGDSIDEIFDAIKNTAIIHKTGGGTGFSFSRLRPKGDIVKKTGGVASGPLSFMQVFNAATEVIKQGGKRRGANMGILNVHHPDILDFIVMKEKETTMTNFNISVAVTDKFMNAVINDKEYDLINPKTGKVVNRLNARVVWNLIVTMAWKTADPGVIFIDRINNSPANPVPSLGPVESTNPCGEQPLYPFDSCNLGSINLGKMIKRKEEAEKEQGEGQVFEFDVDWKKLRESVRYAVHFLDNVIDVNKYPLPQIEQMTRKIRRIGLGVMGWADMLAMLHIPYNTQEALDLAEKIMKLISVEARKMSVELGRKKGSFPAFKDSIWYKMGYPAMRTSTVTTIAPTGTIGVIAGCSQGIEPYFAVAYMRHVGETLGVGENLIEITPVFERMAIQEGFYSEELMRKISKNWSIQQMQEIPANIRRIFITAHDVSPEWHVKMQSAFQKYTDNAVSKTINFYALATPYDIEKAYTLAYQLGCKGITIFRDTSKSVQVITTIQKEGEQIAEQITNGADKETLEQINHIEDGQTVLIEPEYVGGCQKCQI